MINDLRKLIEAVEEGTLDAYDCGRYGRFLAPYCDGRRIFLVLPLDAYHGSVDAAIALCEVLLPEWKVAGLHQEDRGLWWAELRQGFITSYSAVVVAPNTFDAATPARALLLAMLRAKLMEMENE